MRVYIFFISFALYCGSLVLSTTDQGQMSDAIAVSTERCASSSVKNFKALLKEGCWRRSKDGTQCVFTSPCTGKKDKKFKCKKKTSGFCKDCNLCTCKDKKETCEVNVIACKDQLKNNLDQGCFRRMKKKCSFVYPCPDKVECKKGDVKCDKCNHCTCAGGKWACTRKGCPDCPGDCWKFTPDKQCVCNGVCDGANPISTPCNDGDEGCSECNKCGCFNNVWACTLKGCVTKCPSNCWGFDANGVCTCKSAVCRDKVECKKGDEKCDECNRCRCIGNKWACTRKGCRKCPSNCWDFDKNNVCKCKKHC